MNIQIDATIKADDREGIGRAMSELYKDVVKALEGRVLPLPHVEPPPASVKGVYPIEPETKEANK